MIVLPLPELLLVLVSAVVVDLLVGDPKWPTHPVILIGRLIAWLERRLYPEDRLAGVSPGLLRRRGIVLAAAAVAAATAAMWAAAEAASLLHPWLGYAVHVWFISSTIAVKGLGDAALAVFRPLSEGRLEEARAKVGHIVGRDTDSLDESGAARAAVETVAENTSDAFIAPLLFALAGGAPLAMLYRAANTLDSMVGYKNERYLHFGWASARLDDVLNWLPARLTGLLLVLSAALLPGLSPGRAFRSMATFARLHPSPNSGWPEAAAAGAIGIELGGVNSYFGRPSERARMGWPTRPLEAEDIRHAVRMLSVTSYIVIGAGVAAWLLAN